MGTHLSDRRPARQTGEAAEKDREDLLAEVQRL